MKIADLDDARRRLLTLHARSVALLRFGEAKIAELEALKLAAEDEREPDRLAARLVFVEHLWLVRRMASGQPIYEVDEGVHYIMRAPVDTADRRIVAIDQLARTLKITEAEIDAETDRILTIEESDRERCDNLVAEFMAKLPPAQIRRVPSSPRSRRSWRRVVNYDDTALRELELVLPTRRRIELELEERQRLDAQLLGDLDDHLRCDADLAAPASPPIKNTPTRRKALLRAACEIFAEYDVERRAALKRRSTILLQEFPRGAGDGPRYAARYADLDAELLQPHQEGIVRFQGLVIQYAVRFAPKAIWPPGNTMFDRAFALGQTITVPASDLAAARATLGHARVEALEESV